MEWRAVVIGRRSALLSISITAALLLSGVILDKVAFPLNYQIVFGIGMIGAAISSYHLSYVISARRLQDKSIISIQRPTLQLRITNSLRSIREGFITFTRAGISNFFRIDILRTPFGPFIFSYLIFYTITSFPIPIYTLFLVQTIRVSDGVISLGNSIFYIAMILFSLLLARLSKLFGHHKVLVGSAFLYILYPLIGGLAQDPSLFYLASFFGGAAWGLANGALINRLFEKTPENDRPACMAHHNLALNLGTLVGVLIGSALPEWFGLRNALILSGGLRVVGAMVLVFLG